MKFNFKRVLVLCFFCFFGAKKSNAQNHPLKIQFVKMKDSTLIHAIHDFINETNKNTNKKYFLKMTIDEFQHKNHNSYGDTLIHYTIIRVGLNTQTQDSYKYPLFFSMVDNKLVEIYPKGIKEVLELEYTLKSKKKYFKNLKSYIEDIPEYKKIIRGDKNVMYPVTLFSGELHVYKLKGKIAIIEVKQY